MIGAMLCGIVFFTFKAQEDRKAIREDLRSIWLKVFLSSWWFISEATAFTFSFETMADNVLGSFSDLASLGTSYLQYECLLGIDSQRSFNGENWSYLLGPVFLIGMVAATSYLKSRLQESTDSWKDTALSISIIILFVIQPTLTAQAVSYFDCVPLGAVENGWNNMYLTSELSIACGSNEHIHAIVVFAVPMFILYVIGIPLFGFVKVARNSFLLQHLALATDSDTGLSFLLASTTPAERAAYEDRIQAMSTDEIQKLDNEAKQFHRDYGFLFVGYEVKYAWWEAVVTSRKVLISVLAVALSLDHHLQAMLALMLCFGAVVGSCTPVLAKYQV